MRIGIDTTPLLVRSAGMSAYTYHLIKHLLSIGEPHTFCFFPLPFTHFSKGYGWEYVDHLTKIQDALRCIGLGLLDVVSRWKRFPIEEWMGGVDIFHSSEVLQVPIRRGHTVCGIHDLTVLKCPAWHTRRAQNLFKRQFRFVRQYADAVIVPSEYTRRDAVETLNIPEDYIYVVYDGYDPDFAPIEDRGVIEAVWGKYGLHDPYMLYMGTLAPHKNLLRLVEAFYILKKKKRLPHRLVLVGHTYLSEPLFQRVESLGLWGEVVFTGFIPKADVPPLMNGADLLVLPSLYEGFGLPLLEAMACGTPVIASRAASIPEVVGDAGMLVDPYDVEALAETLYQVAVDSDLKADLRRRGLERVRLFSWEKCARETLSVYEHLME